VNQDVTVDLSNHDAVATADDKTIFLEKTMKKMVGVITLLPLIL
jgi:hypothetical protein